MCQVRTLAEPLAGEGEGVGDENGVGGGVGVGNGVGCRVGEDRGGFELACSPPHPLRAMSAPIIKMTNRIAVLRLAKKLEGARTRGGETTRDRIEHTSCSKSRGMNLAVISRKTTCLEIKRCDT